MPLNVFLALADLWGSASRRPVLILAILPVFAKPDPIRIRMAIRSLTPALLFEVGRQRQESIG